MGHHLRSCQWSHAESLLNEKMTDGFGSGTDGEVVTWCCLERKDVTCTHMFGSSRGRFLISSSLHTFGRFYNYVHFFSIDIDFGQVDN